MIKSESKTWEKISDYISENILKAALEVEVKYMVVEAKEAIVHLERPDIDLNQSHLIRSKTKCKARGSTPSMMKSLWDSKGNRWYPT